MLKGSGKNPPVLFISDRESARFSLPEIKFPISTHQFEELHEIFVTLTFNLKVTAKKHSILKSTEKIDENTFEW